MAQPSWVILVPLTDGFRSAFVGADGIAVVALSPPPPSCAGRARGPPPKFDPEVAAASGVSAVRVDAVLMLILAVSILAAMQVLGVTLVAATLVIPATVARLLANSFSRILILSNLVGALTGFVGMNLGYHLDIQSGPTIVLVGAALFGVVFLFSGLAARRRLGGIAVPPGKGRRPGGRRIATTSRSKVTRDGRR